MLQTLKQITHSTSTHSFDRSSTVTSQSGIPSKCYYVEENTKLLVKSLGINYPVLKDLNNKVEYFEVLSEMSVRDRDRLLLHNNGNFLVLPLQRSSLWMKSWKWGESGTTAWMRSSTSLRNQMGFLSGILKSSTLGIHLGWNTQKTGFSTWISAMLCSCQKWTTMSWITQEIDSMSLTKMQCWKN